MFCDSEQAYKITIDFYKWTIEKENNTCDFRVVFSGMSWDIDGVTINFNPLILNLQIGYQLDQDNSNKLNHPKKNWFNVKETCINFLN